MPVETSLEEVRKLILSLLVARPDFTPLPVLDNDYYEAEGNRIPWRRFGFGSLLEFLQSMPQYFLLTYHNGVNCIRGISDKSKHVSSLVARQKKMPRCTPSRFHRSFYHTHVPRSRPKIPAEKLNYLVRYVNSCPNGIYINSALRLIQSQLPYIQLSTYDIQDQLRELGHQVYLDGDTIRPVIKNASALQTSLSRYHQSPLAASEPPVSKSGPSSSNIVYRQSPLAASESPVNKSEPSSSNIVYTVPEEYSDCDTDEDGFVRPNSRTTSLRQAKTNERLVSSLRKHSNYEETVNYHDHHDNQEEKHNNIDNVNYPVNLNMSENESNNLADLISRTMQMRLQLLIEKHPEGIPCSELPNLYMKEFKIPLNYTELGFNSVCTFASYLPDIFYLRRLNMNDDFVLYSANKRAKEQDMIGNDDQETSKSFAQGTTKPINIPNLRQLSDVNDDNAPFPLDLSPDMLDKFVPADVTTSDGISYILVTDLQQDKKQYLEVYIVEVFTPSFFWIHLRKNVKHFEKFMDELHQYYEQSREGYIIPKLALKRGLNCACTYNGYWHRAVIKNVKPDFRVTVMFYDYGTQKTYTSENVFYLAKRFCELPAQAIPCGLYNVKPYVGDRWKKSITDRFIDRISETLLAATVVSIDPPDNSMLIILTDTSEDEDVRINDWLVQENLARSGKMGDSVDMASSTKYVLNSADRLPSYCFAEENLVSDSCSKSTIIEELNESPKVSSGPSFACCDNNQQPRSVPPGFIPINEHADRFNTPASRHYLHSALGSVTSTKAPSLFSDVVEDTSNSPFPDGNSKPSMANITSDILSSDVERQMFAQFMQENTTLQMRLTNSFRCLLRFPPETTNTCLNYTTLLFQFNNALRVLANELDNRLASIIPNPLRNYENDAGLSSKTSHYNPNCESSVNQEAASSSRISLSPLPPPPPPPPQVTSSTANLFGEYHGQYHHAFPTSDMKGFPYSSQHQAHVYKPYNSQLRAHPHSFEQAANQTVVSSHQVDVNGLRVQSPSMTSPNPKSSSFNRYENVAKATSAPESLSPSSFSDLGKGVTNNLFLDVNSKPSVTNFFPMSSDILFKDAEKQKEFAQLYIEMLLHKSALNTVTASHTNTSNVNPSSYHHSTNELANEGLQHRNTYKNEEPTKRKETNPFICYQDDENQIPAEQNAHNNYDMTKLASHLPNINQQSYIPTVSENANVHTTDYFYRTHTRNTTRNESNVDSMLAEYRMYGDAKANSDGDYAPKIVYEAGPVMYKKPEEQQLPSQPAMQLQNNIVINDVDHVKSSSSLIDVSASNDEGYGTTRVTPTIQTNNSPPMTSTEAHYQPDVNTNVLPQHVLPEAWSSSMVENNSLQSCNKNFVSPTMCPSTSLLSHKEWNYETNKDFTTGDSYKTTGPSHASLTDDSEKTMMATCANFWNSSLNKDQKGTSYNCNTSLNTAFLFQQIDSVDGVTILFHMDQDGWILMYEFVEAFTKFSESCRLMLLVETSNVPISPKEVHRFEYPFQFLQLDSYPLSVIRDSKDRITSLNLISLQAALGLLYRLKLISREEIENSFKGNKTFTNNSVMRNIWELMTTYKDFRHRIQQDYGI